MRGEPISPIITPNEDLVRCQRRTNVGIKIKWQEVSPHQTGDRPKPRSHRREQKPEKIPQISKLPAEVREIPPETPPQVFGVEAVLNLEGPGAELLELASPIHIRNPVPTAHERIGRMPAEMAAKFLHRHQLHGSILSPRPLEIRVHPWLDNVEDPRLDRFL